MSIAYPFDDCAVGVQFLVVRRRRRARATGTHGAAGRLAQRADMISCRVANTVSGAKSRP